jgi:hypothetical protein
MEPGILRGEEKSMSSYTKKNSSMKQGLALSKSNGELEEIKPVFLWLGSANNRWPVRGSRWQGPPPAIRDTNHLAIRVRKEMRHDENSN